VMLEEWKEKICISHNMFLREGKTLKSSKIFFFWGGGVVKYSRIFDFHYGVFELRPH
jgi:hypothetical protein